MFDVLIKFPMSMTLEQYQNRIDTIKGWGCCLEPGAALTRPIAEVAEARVSASAKSPADPFTPVAETLTAAEESLLDQALNLTHNKGVSPVIDSMAASGDFGKPIMRNEIIKYYKQNPGHNKRQCATALAMKFIDRYGSFDTAYRKFTTNITAVAYGKNRGLEARDGRVGYGGSAKFYVIGEDNECSSSGQV